MIHIASGALKAGEILRAILIRLGSLQSYQHILSYYSEVLLCSVGLIPMKAWNCNPLA